MVSGDYNYIEPNYKVTDDRFTIDSIADSELIIEISSSFFRFAVRDKRGTFVWLEDYYLILQESPQAFVKELVKDHHLLSVRFWKKIQIICHSRQRCFIPARINESQSQKVFSLLFQSKVSPFFSAHPEGTYLFSADNELIEFFKTFYESERVDLGLAGQNFSFTDQNEPLYIVFEQSGYSIAFKKGDINSYWFGHYDQMLAFLHKFASCSILICGEVTAYSKEFRMLENNFPVVALAKAPYGFRPSQYFQETPYHRYYLIFNS